MSQRRRSAFWGVIFGYGAVGIALVRNILFVPIYLHRISLPEYGAWLATGGALALLLINDFGLAGVVTQKASGAAGAGDLRAFGSLAGSALGIGALMSCVLTVISLSLSPFLSVLESLPLAARHTVYNCFLIAIAANAIGIIGVTTTSLIRSLQESVAAGSITLLADIANIVAILAGIYLGAGLYAIAGAMLVRSLIVALAGFLALKFAFLRRLGVGFEVDGHAIRELLGDSGRFFVTSIAMKMQSQANVFFAGAVLGPTSAAIYALTVRAHETVMMLTSQINTALVPSVTHLLGSGNTARFRAVIVRVLLTMGVLTALAMSVTVSMNAGFLKLWIGHGVFGGQGLSILMALALFVSSLGYVGYDALIAQGRFRLVSSVFGATSLLHIALLLLLLHLGLWAAPAVTLISAAIWSAIFLLNAGRSIAMTAAECRDLVYQLALMMAISASTVALFMWFYPAANSWTELVLQGMLFVPALALGYWIFSGTIRRIAREEISMTLRLFGAR